MTGAPIPVTLLAGFLGSGKTTLLNRILSAEHGQRIAVVVNEFGDVGIDGRLVVGGDEQVVELRNGCLCCTVREDLRATLVDLLARRRRRLLRRASFERVVVEASGMASPGPAIQTLLVDPELAHSYRVDGVITLAHAAHVARQLDEHPEAAEQVGYADRILLNHADTADADTLASAEASLRACNARADVVRTVRAEADVAQLLALETLADRPLQGAADGPPHSCGVGTFTLTTDAAIDPEALRMWLGFVAQRKTSELMRVKGILRTSGDSRATVVQGIYQWLELSPGAQAAPRESVLVFIGRGLDAQELQKGWRAAQVAVAEGEGGS